MKVIVSDKINFDLLPFVEEKLVRKRINQLENCSVLGEVKYGRPHHLRGCKTGMYGLRIGKKSRLLLLPCECDMTQQTKGKSWLHCITGVIVFYSPNHYGTYY
jgi:hypothetical protein